MEKDIVEINWHFRLPEPLRGTVFIYPTDVVYIAMPSLGSFRGYFNILELL